LEKNYREEISSTNELFSFAFFDKTFKPIYQDKKSLPGYNSEMIAQLVLSNTIENPTKLIS
jgi:hypothetical protein